MHRVRKNKITENKISYKFTGAVFEVQKKLVQGY